MVETNKTTFHNTPRTYGHHAAWSRKSVIFGLDESPKRRKVFSRCGAPFPSLRSAASAVNALPVFVDCVFVFKSDQDGTVAAAVDADMRRAAVCILVMAPPVSRDLKSLWID